MKALLLAALLFGSSEARAVLLPHDATDLCFDVDGKSLRCALEDVAFWLRRSDLLEAMQNAGPAPKPEPQEIKADNEPLPTNVGLVVGLQSIVKGGVPDSAGTLTGGVRISFKNFHVHYMGSFEGESDSKRVGGGYFLAIPVLTRYGVALVDGKKLEGGKIEMQRGIRFSLDGGEANRLVHGRDRFVHFGTEFVAKAGAMNAAVGIGYDRTIGMSGRFRAEDGTLVPEPAGMRKGGIRLTATVEWLAHESWFPRVKK
jgi:hypothetical protein